MYLPYFRCKGEEINSLIAVSKEIFKNTLPILEPIGISKVPVNKFKKIIQANIPFVLIINPQINETSMQKIIETYINGLLSSYSNYSIAYIIHSKSTKKEVETFLSIPNLEKSFIHNREIQNTDIINVETKFQIFNDKKVSPIYISDFDSNNKVILVDGFDKLSRNADYPSKSFFSDKHLNYKKENFIGVADFLIQGDNFSESGGAAYAVAIHLTTENSKGVYINHFISDNREGKSRTAEKFMEALNHLISYANSNPIIQTSGLLDYKDLYNRQHFPGLGVNKRIALKHHLETISSII